MDVTAALEVLLDYILEVGLVLIIIHELRQSRLLT